MSGKHVAIRPRRGRFLWVAALALLGTQLAVTAVLALDQISGHEAVAISGGSMEPTFARGDLVWLDLTERPHPGDIITFRAPSGDGTVITHRVISEGGDAYRTRGDANQYEDVSSVPAGNVIGVVHHHVPRLGFVVLVLLSGWGKLATYGPVLALVLAAEIRGLPATLRARRRAIGAPVVE